MNLEEAKHKLRVLVEEAKDSPDMVMSVPMLKEILEGLDNDEQVIIMHNTAAALLLRLGGQAELRPQDALELHHTHTIKLSRLPQGNMLLRVLNKAEEN
ncbi:hypothetical protein [Nitrospira sp. Nam74]|jgi:hypothetical protein